MNVPVKFSIGQRVHIDSDKSICGIVTAVTVRGLVHHITYQVSWFHDGNSRDDWFSEDRLSEEESQ